MAASHIFTLSAAARALGIPEGTLRRFTDEGLIPDHRDSANRRVFTRLEIETAREVVAERQQANRHGR